MVLNTIDSSVEYISRVEIGEVGETGEIGVAGYEVCVYGGGRA